MCVCVCICIYTLTALLHPNTAHKQTVMSPKDRQAMQTRDSKTDFSRRWFSADGFGP